MTTRQASSDARAVPSGWRLAGVRVSGGYFWYYASIGAFMPFAALYYQELGLSGLHIGVLTAMPPLAMALLGPVFGALADALAIHRLLLRVCLVLVALIAIAAAQVTTVAPLMILIGLLAITMVSIPSLLDSYALGVTEQTGASYGSMRVWGSIGFMALSFIVGQAMGDRVSSLVLLAYASCIGLTLVAVYGVPLLAERYPRPLLGSLGMVRESPAFRLLLALAFLTACGATSINVFLGVHIQALGGSAGMAGTAFAISAGSELPVVAFGGWFLSRIGAVRLIALGLVVYAARCAAYAVIETPAWILPVQLLHGLSYGAFLMASVTLAHRIAGKGQAATAQALLTAMSFGFGSIAGSLVGGALLDRIGTDGLFRLAAATMVLTLLLLLSGNRLTPLDDRSAGEDQEPAIARPG